jgi:hypothetical protein
MIKLCAKDFLAGRWWWLLALVFYGLNIAMNTGHALFFMVATPALVATCLILTLVQDYVNKTEALYVSLPLTRATIVAGRYGLAAFLTAGGFLIALGSAFVLKSALSLQSMNFSPRPWASIDGLTGYVLAMASFAALYLPLYYRLGLGRSTAAFGLIMLAVAVGILTLKPMAALRRMLGRGLESPEPSGDAAFSIVGAVGHVRQAMGTPAFLAAAAIAVALMLVASFRLSVKFYEKNDL